LSSICLGINGKGRDGSCRVEGKENKASIYFEPSNQHHETFNLNDIYSLSGLELPYGFIWFSSQMNLHGIIAYMEVIMWLQASAIWVVCTDWRDFF
jgi:hypothetical protein